MWINGQTHATFGGGSQGGATLCGGVPGESSINACVFWQKTLSATRRQSVGKTSDPFDQITPFKGPHAVNLNAPLTFAVR
jgi:hypothetical protein